MSPDSSGGPSALRSLGGFLGLERTASRVTGELAGGATLSTGRACLRMVLELERPRRVLMPAYLCDAVVRTVRDAAVEARFYPLTEALEPEGGLPDPGPGELLLAVSYFGLAGRAALGEAEALGSRLVRDDSQAFFRPGSPRVWSFTSARKFFGVPDGAYLRGPDLHRLPALPPATPSLDYLRLRSEGRDEEAYCRFLAHEASLDAAPRGISEAARGILRRVDYSVVAKRRRANYQSLREALGPENRLRLPLTAGDVPLYYPFLPDRPLHAALLARGVLVPRLWPEVAARRSRSFARERLLAEHLCPLPVDQRYGTEDMHWVAGQVGKALAELRRGTVPSRKVVAPRPVGGALRG